MAAFANLNNTRLTKGYRTRICWKLTGRRNRASQQKNVLAVTKIKEAANTSCPWGLVGDDDWNRTVLFPS